MPAKESHDVDPERKAFANNAITLIASQADPQQLTGCLGFEITRLYNDDSTRVLAAWVHSTGNRTPIGSPRIRASGRFRNSRGAT
jgi:hypothetical protein